MKSLTALDYGGGTISAMSYDSEEPQDRRLKELNMSIPEKGAISSFLDSLKGVRISLPMGSEPLECTIVGIEEAQRFYEGTLINEAYLAVLAEGGRLVSVPLSEVNSLSLLDENIRRDLETLLDILLSGLHKDHKRLTIQARGQDRREVSISYIVEGACLEDVIQDHAPRNGPRQVTHPRLGNGGQYHGGRLEWRQLKPNCWSPDLFHS